MGNAVGFGPFHLDLRSGELSGNGARVVLQDKPFRILALLLQRPGEVVLRDQIRHALWPDGTFVDFEHGLNTAMGRLRAALSDSADQPRFIETVPRRGYRFVAATTRRETPVVSIEPAPLVGRDGELERLGTLLSIADRGIRQCVFVTGEAGTGKSALVSQLLRDASARGTVCVGEGRAMERGGTTDSYGPVLEALGSLARCHPALVTPLTRHAPRWMAQLPSFADDARPYLSDRSVATASQTRMLRELLPALEATSVEHLILLVLADLHWSDDATTEFVNAFACARGRARLFIVATYRPAEATTSRHRIRHVKQDLRAHGRCDELALGGLTAAAIDEYLVRRFPGLEVSRALAEALHARTEGHPMFLINCLDALVAEGQLVRAGNGFSLQGELDYVRRLLPSSLAEIIGIQIDRLLPDQQALLQAASVIGMNLSASLVASVTGRSIDDVEDALDELARGGEFVDRAATMEWPDGSTSSGYRFTHGLCQQVLYEGVRPARRAALRRRAEEARQ